MNQKLDLQCFFVKRVLSAGLTSDVAIAAIWYRDNKAWKLPMNQAIQNFKRWIA